MTETATLARPKPRIDHPAELERVVARIVERLDPVAIYLFGSRARGDGDRQSDYDLVVVVADDFLAGQSNAATAFATVEGHRIPLDLIMVRERAFSVRQGAVGTLEYQVAREGIAIYGQGRVTSFRYPSGEGGQSVPSEAEVDDWIREIELLKADFGHWLEERA